MPFLSFAANLLTKSLSDKTPTGELSFIITRKLTSFSEIRRAASNAVLFMFNSYNIFFHYISNLCHTGLDVFQNKNMVMCINFIGEIINIIVKVGVIVFPGSNCDRDMFSCFIRRF